MDLIERNLAARPDKIAYIDDDGGYSFAELAERVNRCANALTGLGLTMETPRDGLPCSTPSTSRPYFSARSKPALCRLRSIRCSPAATYEFHAA